MRSAPIKDERAVRVGAVWSPTGHSTHRLGLGPPNGVPGSIEGEGVPESIKIGNGLPVRQTQPGADRPQLRQTS